MFSVIKSASFHFDFSFCGCRWCDEKWARPWFGSCNISDVVVPELERSVSDEDGCVRSGTKLCFNLCKNLLLDRDSVWGTLRVSKVSPGNALLSYIRNAYRHGNGCYGLCAWLPWKNIDLILKGCSHILGSLPIVMIIRLPWVTSE